MITGTQFRGTLPAHATQRWFTFNWPATGHVIWEVVPETAQPGAAQVDWDVAIERADNDHVTYWITATNLTAAPLQIAGRYAVAA
jgi:hypothetical protein